MRLETPTVVSRQIERMDAASARIDAAIAAKSAERAATWARNKPRGRKVLPPFGRRWIESGGRYGPAVAFGPGAWEFAGRRQRCLVMVAPSDRDPLHVDWSLLDSRPTLLFEIGSLDTPLLERVALALLMAGVPLVFPIRQLLADSLPLCPPAFVRDGYVVA